jgi:hypothetical protein
MYEPSSYCAGRWLDKLFTKNKSGNFGGPEDGDPSSTDPEIPPKRPIAEPSFQTRLLRLRERNSNLKRWGKRRVLISKFAVAGMIRITANHTPSFDSGSSWTMTSQFDSLTLATCCLWAFVVSTLAPDLIRLCVH